jgi:acyl dehydratase
MAVQKETGRVSSAELARLREKLGQEVRVADPPYLTELTRDAIRHWAWGIGDRNPLYLDEEYARSAVGSLIGPPTILYAFSRLAIGYRGGLPGVHSMFGGSDWLWRRPLRVGEQIRARVVFKDLVELQSRFAGRTWKQLSEISFTTTDGEEVAKAESWGLRMERTSAREGRKYSYLEQKTYEPEEIEALARAYENETCWDDVGVGTDVPSLVRGPYTPTIAVAFEQGWGGLFVRAHGYWFDYLARHPAAGMLNQYGVPEPPEAVHWDSELARSVGVPAAYDYGPERISWIATMLTNWIGDRGRLNRLYCEIRRFNVVGDLTTCGGSVTGKREDGGGDGIVELSIWAEDHRGEQTVKGSAEVLLPKRPPA